MDSPSDWIAISEIARLHGKHKSAVHKVVARLGIDTAKRRSPEHRGQLATYISTADYKRMVDEFRTDDAITADTDVQTTGVFYLIQLEPEHDPGRFKIGFASDVNQRLRAHRTAAPLAKLVKTWPCKLLWEKTAIECVAAGCERLYAEVFRTRALEDVIGRGDRFFDLMPALLKAREDGDAE